MPFHLSSSILCISPITSFVGVCASEVKCPEGQLIAGPSGNGYSSKGFGWAVYVLGKYMFWGNCICFIAELSLGGTSGKTFLEKKSSSILSMHNVAVCWEKNSYNAEGGGRERKQTAGKFCLTHQMWDCISLVFWGPVAVHSKPRFPGLMFVPPSRPLGTLCSWVSVLESFQFFSAMCVSQWCGAAWDLLHHQRVFQCCLLLSLPAVTSCFG